MWPRSLRTALLGAILALAPACQEQGASPQVQLVTSACEGALPLAGVTHLRLRVTGEGLATPIERVTPVDLRPEDIPAVPPGERRVLEVRGYTGEPTSAGRVVSVGRSLPFDMPPEGAPARPVRIILRRVETFVPVESAQQPGTCLELTRPRAGHTATLLPDGRVVLAGGFQVTAEGATETLDSIELLDPQALMLAYLPSPGEGAARRAFHTASLMREGRVALVGGEVQSPLGATPLRSVAVFDPATASAEQFELAAARSRHEAAIDISGRILLVGGVGEGGTVLSEPEGVEPAAKRSFLVPTPLSRVGISALPLPDGQRIVVLGGSDGTSLPREVLTFAFNGTTFVPSDTGLSLRQPRRNAALTLYEDGQRLLVLGGYGEAAADSVRSVSASEIIHLGAEDPGVKVGPSIVDRGDLCAVMLPGGRVLAAGGRRLGGSGLASSGSVELITPSTNVTGGVLGMPPLQPPRYLHTCTPLPDGSVLVVGGLDTSSETPRMAGGAFVFMPVPRD